MDIIPFVTEPLPAWVSPFLGVSLFSLLIVGGFNLLALMQDYNRWAKVLLPFTSLFFLGVVVGLGGLGVDFMQTYRASAEWTVAVREEAKDVYGFWLTNEQLFDLRFPSSEPDEDFATFGSISMDIVSGDVASPQPVTLVWSGDELLLAHSVDGEQFTELNR